MCAHDWEHFFKFDRLRKYRCRFCGAVKTVGLEMFDPDFDPDTYSGDQVVEITPK